jgi:toxin CptA
MNCCKLYPSRIFLALLLTAYSLAILVVFILPVAAWIRYTLGCLLLFWLTGYVLRDVLLILPSSWVAMRLEEEKVVLFCRNGKELTGKILPGSLVTPLLTILNVSLPGKRFARNVILFPDSLDQQRFREMRVQLKWGGAIGES